MTRILLTHTPEARANYYGASALEALRTFGDVKLHEGNVPLLADELIKASAGCAVIVADRATAVPANVFGSSPDLVAVVRVAVDVRNIDIDAASQHGILVTQASRSWIPAVSELVIGLMIDAARGISRAKLAYSLGNSPNILMGQQLNGAVAGIIGYGPLGRNVARLCTAFGMTVVVHDPYVGDLEDGHARVDLDDLLARSDFVIPLAVATAETENLINARRLAQMKPAAYLINLSRGNLIDESALETALDREQIAGAGLDVGRAADQMPSLHLARRPDVTATPHIGGLTRGAIEGQALETVAQVGEILQRRAPKGSLNAAAAVRLATLLP